MKQGSFSINNTYSSEYTFIFKAQSFPSFQNEDMRIFALTALLEYEKSRGKISNDAVLVPYVLAQLKQEYFCVL